MLYWANQIPLHEWRTSFPSCRQLLFISNFQDYFKGRVTSSRVTSPSQRSQAQVTYYLEVLIAWLSSKLRHLKRVMPSWLLWRMPCSSTSVSLYQIVCSYFSFSRCWFQQVSLISVCSLISIAQAVFWGAQFAQVSGEQFEQLTCVIVFCEVNTIVVPILQRRKRKHKEVSYLLLLVNSLLTSWITCQRLHKFLVAESGFKPQTLWTPEFTILATALITGHFAYKKTFTRQHERK